jgi:hypothetical protein
MTLTTKPSQPNPFSPGLTAALQMLSDAEHVYHGEVPDDIIQSVQGVVAAEYGLSVDHPTLHLLTELALAAYKAQQDMEEYRKGWLTAQRNSKDLADALRQVALERKIFSWVNTALIVAWVVSHELRKLRGK